MSTRNIQLTEHYNKFVDNLIHSGRFRDAGEVIRAGLRLLEQQSREDNEKLKLLRSLTAEGFDQIDQGKGIQFEGERQLAEFIGQVGRRVAGNTVKRKKGK